MGEARRALVRGLSTARQELNLIPRKAPSRLTNRLVRTRMLGGVRGRGLAALSYSMHAWHIRQFFVMMFCGRVLHVPPPELAQPLPAKNRQYERRGRDWTTLPVQFQASFVKGSPDLP